jgi:hypothetical protein
MARGATPAERPDMLEVLLLSADYLEARRVYDAAMKGRGESA